MNRQNWLEKEQGEGRQLGEPFILPPYLRIQVFLYNHASSLVDSHPFSLSRPSSPNSYTYIFNYILVLLVLQSLLQFIGVRAFLGVIREQKYGVQHSRCL